MFLTRHFVIFATVLGLFLGFSAHDVYADVKITKLTEKNVTDFIQKTADLTSGKNVDMGSDEVSAYLEKHLDDDARFKSSMQFNVPGHPPQSNALALGKAEFIAQVQQGAQAVDGYENETEVKKVKISKDGTRATVETKGFESGTMMFADQSGAMQEVPIEGTSTCNQILKLSDEGVIQMYNANCVTKITFKEF